MPKALIKVGTFLKHNLNFTKLLKLVFVIYFIIFIALVQNTVSFSNMYLGLGLFVISTHSRHVLIIVIVKYKIVAYLRFFFMIRVPTKSMFSWRPPFSDKGAPSGHNQNTLEQAFPKSNTLRSLRSRYIRVPGIYLWKKRHKAVWFSVLELLTFCRNFLQAVRART